jgi:hypothetical protein
LGGGSRSQPRHNNEEGLHAEYFSNINLNGEATVTRTDKVVNFN